MQLKTAQRQAAKIKLAIQGPSGSGKTYSSLLLAHGLYEDWKKIAVIDTENGSAHLYSALGPFQVMSLDTPHSPERYIEAIGRCLKARMEVIIIDGISPCWEFLLDFHSRLTGNSFANWSKVTPRHNAFVHGILHAEAHIICTLRTKQDYVLNQKDGKYVPEKVGLKAIQRDGIDYDFTIVFDLDHKHNASPSKDRTGLFMDNPEYTAFRITQDTGKRIKDWCNAGATKQSLQERIAGCTSMKELMRLYKEDIQLSKLLQDDFTARRKQLQAEYPNPLDPSSNGNK